MSPVTDAQRQLSGPPVVTHSALCPSCFGLCPFVSFQTFHLSPGLYPLYFYPLPDDHAFIVLGKSLYFSSSVLTVVGGNWEISVLETEQEFDLSEMLLDATANSLRL